MATGFLRGTELRPRAVARPDSFTERRNVCSAPPPKTTQVRLVSIPATPIKQLYPEYDDFVDNFKAWVMQFDRNGDGKISLTELYAAIRSTKVNWLIGGFRCWQGVAAADKDNNGVIDEYELDHLARFFKNNNLKPR